MKHVCCDCIYIAKVLGFYVIHMGLPPQDALAVTEAVKGRRVTPSCELTGQIVMCKSCSSACQRSDRLVNDYE